MSPIRRSMLGWRKWWRSDQARRLSGSPAAQQRAVAEYDRRLKQRSCVLPEAKRRDGEEQRR